MGLLESIFSRLPRRQPHISSDSLPIEGHMPPFEGITKWLNTDPLTTEDLRGKVVLVDFWTISCINCLRTIPHLKAWHKTYANKGLRIIGIHTPEFPFEKDIENVEREVRRYGLDYAIAIDNDYTMWNAYKNHYWPAHYFIDGKGDVRYHHFGEGKYGHSEAIIKSLLRENGAVPSATVVSEKVGSGPDFEKIGSPETYLGFDRMEYLGSPESVRVGEVQEYSGVREPALNVFYFDGKWEVNEHFAVPKEAGAKIIYRARAAKMNLVMDGVGKEHRVSVRINNKALDETDAGTDIGNPNATSVTVTNGRLYNLVDTKGAYGEYLLEMTFEDPGMHVYAFTFG